MSKHKKISIIEFTRRYSTEEACREHLAEQRWPEGFVCPCCGNAHAHQLSNGRYQCSKCRHQTSVTAGTFMHRSHVSLKKWFLAFYFVTQDKRGVSATQLSFLIAVTYKTAWFMLRRIRKAMGQRDERYLLDGVVEFDDTYFGGPTVGKKRGRGTEKAKAFVALSLDNDNNPKFLKIGVTDNIKKLSVKKFAKNAIQPGSAVISDGYRSYVPALKNYHHQPKPYDPNSGELMWLHTIIGNAKAFILGTYHGLPKQNLSDYLNEFCFRFNRRNFVTDLYDHLAAAMLASPLAE